MIALVRLADKWIGSEAGVEFTIRPLDGPPPADTLFENTRYHVAVNFGTLPLKSTEIRVGGLSLSTWVEGTIRSGHITVGHTFGALNIDAIDHDVVVASASVDIRPRHLDVDTDFAEIKADIDRVSYSLAYAVWRRAHQQAFADFSVPGGVPEWLALLRHSWSRIMRAMTDIARDPNTELLSIREVRRADRAGAIDARGLRWLAQTPSAWAASDHPFPVASIPIGSRFVTPERAMVVRREVTLDTPANRALKAVLLRLESKLRLVIRDVEALPPRHFASGAKAEYVQQLSSMLRESQRYTVHGFLSAVDDRQVRSVMRPHVVRADPRYRQVFRAIGVIQWGVVSGVGGPIAEMSLKDTWELYEYWVYLFILGWFASSAWDVVQQGALSVTAPGAPILLDLARGEHSQSQFEHVDPLTGNHRLATVTFHRAFPSRRANAGLGRGALTVTRDVDILIEAEVAGILRRAVFDPKYRGELSDTGCLTCPVSAVNDMHVYRDSIGRWEAGALGARIFVRTLDAAVAVFPARDEACFKHELLYESLRDGVGALPLLPPDGTGPHLLPDFLVNFLA